MAPHPANARRHQAMRAAKRAALARPILRLDPNQLKLVLAEHDALCAKSNALMQEAQRAADGAPSPAQDPALDRVYAVALRRLDQLDKQGEALDAKAAELSAHPQVRAAILAREKAAERAS